MLKKPGLAAGIQRESDINDLAKALGVNRFHYTWDKLLSIAKERSDKLVKINLIIKD